MAGFDFSHDWVTGRRPDGEIDLVAARFRPINDWRRHRRWYLALLVVCGIWCIVDVMPRGRLNARQPWMHRTDFTVYTEAGAAFFDGRDPYEVVNPRGWHYLYPPLFAILVAPLHALTTTTQVGIWFAVSIVLCYGSYCETRRLIDHLAAQREGPGADASALPGFVRWAALLAVLLPSLNCLQRGQVEVLKLYLLLLGLRLMLSGRRRRQWWFAGVVLALPVVLKLTPLLPVCMAIFYEAFVVRFRATERRISTRGPALGVGVVSGLVLFVLLLPAALTNWNANIVHLKTWFVDVVTKANDVRSSDFGEHASSLRNQSLENGLFRFGNWLCYEMGGAPSDRAIDRTLRPTYRMPMDDVLSDDMILGIRVIALACLVLISLRAAQSDDSLGRAAVFGLACAATLVVCPIARGPYFVLMLPAVLFNSIWMVRLRRARAAHFAAIVPAVLVWLHYLFLQSSGRIGLLGVGTTIWYFATCLVLDRALRSSHPSTILVGFRDVGQGAHHRRDALVAVGRPASVGLGEWTSVAPVPAVNAP